MSTETPEKAKQQVASALDFKARRDERNKATLVELPSGVSVELKRPSVDKLIRSGHIPADVAVSVQKLEGKDTSTLKGDDLTNYFQVIDLMVEYSMVVPKVKKGECTDEDYENGFISIDDVEENDKVFIMKYVQSGNKDLSKFRLDP